MKEYIIGALVGAGVVGAGLYALGGKDYSVRVPVVSGGSYRSAPFTTNTTNTAVYAVDGLVVDGDRVIVSQDLLKGMSSGEGRAVINMGSGHQHAVVNDGVVVIQDRKSLEALTQCKDTKGVTSTVPTTSVTSTGATTRTTP